jgi:hypothetical protein
VLHLHVLFACKKWLDYYGEKVPYVNNKNLQSENILCMCRYRNSVADPDPRSGAFLTPGSGIRNLFNPGSGMGKIRILDKHTGTATLAGTAFIKPNKEGGGLPLCSSCPPDQK